MCRWLLLKIAGIPTGEVEKWISDDGDANQSLDLFKNFVRNIECTNDCAERNIKLIQDFGTPTVPRTTMPRTTMPRTTIPRTDHS
jgi:hypothetical protein